MRKKILVVSPWYYPNFCTGGTAVAAYNFTSKLHEMSNVKVLTTSKAASSYKKVRNRIPNIRYLNPLFKWLPRSEIFSMRIIFYLLLNAHKYDLVWLHSSRNPYTVATFVNSIFKNSKYMITPHGSYLETWINEIGHPKFKKLYNFCVEKFIVKKAASIHFLSQHEAENSWGASLTKSIVFPNFVSYHDYQIKSFNSKNFKLIFVGRIHPQKNLLNLVKAVSRLKNFTLDIYGVLDDVEYFKKIKPYLGQQISFKGFIEHDELQRIYNKYDLLVMPSIVEGVSMALLEAMSQSIPALISTGHANVNEIMSKNASFVSEIDVEAITKKLASINRTSLKKISENSYNFYYKFYSPHSIERILKKLVQNL